MKDSVKEKKEHLGVNKKKRLGLKVGITILALLIAACAVYVMTPYRAGETVSMYFDEQSVSAVAVLEGYQKVTMQQTDNGYTVAAPEDAIAGLIFYPGGRVKSEAYVPLIYAFAQRGILCVLADMPLNFAVFDINAADGIKEQYPDIDEWYVGGHSLGGAMAAYYADDHADEYAGLVLLGAYTSVDLSDTDLKVFLAYGTQDGVINRSNYAKGLKKIPADSSELIIVGGCHAYFGDYGKQLGDGHPFIDRADQIKYTADALADYILQDKAAK